MAERKPLQIADFSDEPGLVIEGDAPSQQQQDFQKSKSLRTAESNLASQLSDIQKNMSEIQARRAALQEQQAQQAESARNQVMLARLADASNMIGGINTQLGKEAEQATSQEKQQLQQQAKDLEMQNMTLSDFQRSLQDQGVALTQQEEKELGEFEQLAQQEQQALALNDPNSELSKQARQEFAMLGIDLPESMTASQIQRNRDLMLKRQEMLENRQFEEQKFMRQQALEEAKYQRDQALQEKRRKEDLEIRTNEMLTRQGLAIAKPQIAAYRTATASIESARDYQANIEQIMKTPPTPAGDAMLVEQLSQLANKVNMNIDVNGENADLMSKSLFNQIKGININRLQDQLRGTGGALTPEERNNLKELSKVFFANIDNDIATLKKGREFLRNIPLKGELKSLLPEYLGSESLSNEDLDELEKQVQDFSAGKMQFEDYAQNPDQKNTSTADRTRNFDEYFRSITGKPAQQQTIQTNTNKPTSFQDYLKQKGKGGQ